MKKFLILILFLLFSFSNNSLEDCQAISALSCTNLGVEYEIPEEYDIYGFQTPQETMLLEIMNQHIKICDI